MEAEKEVRRDWKGGKTDERSETNWATTPDTFQLTAETTSVPGEDRKRSIQQEKNVEGDEKTHCLEGV